MCCGILYCTMVFVHDSSHMVCELFPIVKVFSICSAFVFWWCTCVCVFMLCFRVEHFSYAVQWCPYGSPACVLPLHVCAFSILCCASVFWWCACVCFFMLFLWAEYSLHMAQWFHRKLKMAMQGDVQVVQSSILWPGR